MISIAFLKGIKRNYNASKTFKKQADKLIKVSDYAIGQTFTHETVPLPPQHAALAAELQRRATAGWFHILGQPRDDLPQRVRRLKVNFIEAPTTLLVLDIDKYDLPPDIAQQWTDSRPQTTATIIRRVLSHLQLTPLAMGNFTFVLSSSQLNRKRLSAHVYFFLDTPVTLPDLRRWAMVLNKGLGQKIIDEAVFRSVQPIYIAPPTCIGFTDPFPLTARISYSEPLPGQLVSLSDLLKLGFTVNGQPVPPQSDIVKSFEDYAHATTRKQFELRGNYLDTLETFCGTAERGIHEVCLRAAAQLVNEEGSSTVRDNIEHYAKLFYDAQWKAIRHHGARGDQDDQMVYTEDKARAYIESAVDKDFGEQADRLAKEIRDAIEAAKNAGNPNPLLARPVMRAYARLSQDHLTKHAAIREELKNAKIVSISHYEKAAGLVGPDDQKKIDITDQTRAVNAVMNRFTLIRAETGIDYLHVLDKTSSTGYYVIPTMSPKLSTFLHSTFVTVTKQIPPTGLSAMLRDTLQAKIHFGGFSREIEKAKVSRRIYSENNTIYYRAGKIDGTDITVKMTPGKVSYIRSDRCPVYWDTSNFCSTTLPTASQLEKEFGTKTPSYKQAREYLRQNIRYFIACNAESAPSVVSLAVSLLCQTPLIYIGVFQGGSGNGKTFGASAFKTIFDPKTSDERIDLSYVRILSKKFLEDDYAQFLENDVMCYDNVERLSNYQQSVFSQLSTGSSMSRRILYTQMLQQIQLRQSIIMTSTGYPVSAPDLKTRTLTIEFDQNMRRHLGKRDLNRLPLLRHCFFVFTAEYLRYQAQLDVDIDSRSYIDALVRTMFRTDDVTSGQVIAEANIKKYSDIIEDPLIAMFTAYLDERGGSTIEFYSGDRYRLFKDWVRTHNGTQKQAKMMLDNDIIDMDVTISSADLPDSITVFDIKMSSAIPYINAMTMWETSRYKHSRNRRMITVYENKIEKLLGL